MNRTCSISHTEFSISDEDLAFYQRMSVPPPTLAPDERARKRLSFINNRNYARVNGLISPYAESKNFVVLPYTDWLEEKIDPVALGREFDFSRPFFPQFRELQQVAPRWNFITYQCENCDWSINCAHCRNCYLVRSSIAADDCFYCDKIQRCRDCADCLNISDCELCYEVVEAERCYAVSWSQHVEDCRESACLFDCRSCSNCLGCVGLIRGEYCVLNQTMTKEQFEELYQRYITQASYRAQFDVKFRALLAQYEHPCVRVVNSQDCHGDRLYNCKNVVYGFQLKNCEDSAYLHKGTTARSCWDCSQPDEFELAYEVATSYKVYDCRGCFNCVELTQVDYSETCGHLSHCFGCVGLYRKQFHILNKPYSQEDYFSLRSKIIEHMQATGEWGEFFAPANSPFDYNDSVAQEHFPLEEEEAKALGYNWHPSGMYLTDDFLKHSPPAALDALGQEELLSTQTCSTTSRKFKFQKAELDLYAKLNVSAPCEHPEVRYARRRIKQNPIQLFSSTCAVSGEQVWTSFSPTSNVQVVSEEEYRKRFA